MSDEKGRYFPFESRAEHDMVNRLTVSIVRINCDLKEIRERSLHVDRQMKRLVKTMERYSLRAFKRTRKADKEKEKTKKMKRLILFILCMFCFGCTFVYDSTNQNFLNLDKPEYNDATAKKVKIRTGRYIRINVLTK